MVAGFAAAPLLAGVALPTSSIALGAAAVVGTLVIAYRRPVQAVHAAGNT